MGHLVKVSSTGSEGPGAGGTARSQGLPVEPRQGYQSPAGSYTHTRVINYACGVLQKEAVPGKTPNGEMIPEVPCAMWLTAL